MTLNVVSFQDSFSESFQNEIYFKAYEVIISNLLSYPKTYSHIHSARIKIFDFRIITPFGKSLLVVKLGS